MHRANYQRCEIRTAGIRHLKMKDVIARHGHVADVRADADVDVVGRVELCICAGGLAYDGPLSAAGGIPNIEYRITNIEQGAKLTFLFDIGAIQCSFAGGDKKEGPVGVLRHEDHSLRFDPLEFAGPEVYEDANTPANDLFGREKSGNA